jgi:hypothetical protein
MSKLTKTLLGISIVLLTAGLLFVTGFINAESIVALYVALPAGAIVFGLFLISKCLEKEVVGFDEEYSAALKLSERRPGTTETLPLHSHSNSVASAAAH